MDSFIFALSAVAPIIAMVAIGYFLKRIGWMNADFAKAANRLVFRVFMPVMLFVNIYKIESLVGVDLRYMLYSVLALLGIFLLSIVPIFLVAGAKDRRGVLMQAITRSGYSLIGFPIAYSLWGEEGRIAAALLSVAVIPLFNVLAVVSLSAFGDGAKKPSVKKILLDIAKNPLILGIAAAMIVILVRSLFVKCDVSFRLTDIGPLFSVLNYLADLAVPLALLVLGAQFELSAVSSLKKEIILGVVARTVVAPMLTIGVAYFAFGDLFTPAHYACFVALFATPVAVPSVPMVQEVGGDLTLAGQLVVWSTLASAFTMFATVALLRFGGAF